LGKPKNHRFGVAQETTRKCRNYRLDIFFNLRLDLFFNLLFFVLKNNAQQIKKTMQRVTSQRVGPRCGVRVWSKRRLAVADVDANGAAVWNRQGQVRGCRMFFKSPRGCLVCVCVCVCALLACACACNLHRQQQQQQQQALTTTTTTAAPDTDGNNNDSGSRQQQQRQQQQQHW